MLKYFQWKLFFSLITQQLTVKLITDNKIYLS